MIDHFTNFFGMSGQVSCSSSKIPFAGVKQTAATTRDSNSTRWREPSGLVCSIAWARTDETTIGPIILLTLNTNSLLVNVSAFAGLCVPLVATAANPQPCSFPGYESVRSNSRAEENEVLKAELNKYMSNWQELLAETHEADHAKATAWLHPLLKEQNGDNA